LFLDSARWSYIFKQTLKHQAILANKRKVEKFPHRSRFYLLSQKYLTVPQTNTNPHSKRNSLGKSMFYKSERLYFIYIYIYTESPPKPSPKTWNGTRLENNGHCPPPTAGGPDDDVNAPWFFADMLDLGGPASKISRDQESSSLTLFGGV